MIVILTAADSKNDNSYSRFSTNPKPILYTVMFRLRFHGIYIIDGKFRAGIMLK